MEGVSYLLFCFNRFKSQNLRCATNFILVTFSWHILAKQFLSPSQASVAKSDIFVEMNMFACKQVSVLEQVSVNLGLCAIWRFPCLDSF